MLKEQSTKKIKLAISQVVVETVQKNFIEQISRSSLLENRADRSVLVSKSLNESSKSSVTDNLGRFENNDKLSNKKRNAIYLEKNGSQVNR